MDSTRGTATGSREWLQCPPRFLGYSTSVIAFNG